MACDMDNMRAMQEIKEKTWELLIEGSPPGEEVVAQTTMSKLISQLPERVSENSKKFVTTGGLFSILLSIATQKNVTLIQHADLKDVTIIKEPRPAPARDPEPQEVEDQPPENPDED